jgi:gliding motility-associated-like protein
MTTMYIDSFVWYNFASKNRLSENDTLLLSTSIADSTPYLVRAYHQYDGVTCFAEDTASLKINPLPVLVSRPADVKLCADQPTVLLNGVQTSVPATNQTTQTWTYPQDPTAITGSTLTTSKLKNLPGTWLGSAYGNWAYLAVRSNETGCISNDSIAVAVFPVDKITLINPPRQCDFNTTFNLNTLVNPPSLLTSGGFFEWAGRGVSYVSSTNRYIFTPSDSLNSNLDKRVRSGLTSPSDTNILSFNLNRTFNNGNPVPIGGLTPPSPGRTIATQGFFCAAFDTVIMRVTKTPKLKAGVLPTVCAGGDSVFLTNHAVPGSNYTTAVNPLTSYWYFAAPNTNFRAIARGQVFMPFHSNIVVPKDQRRDYSLVFADTSANGCRVADTTKISVRGVPTVEITTSPVADSAVCKTQAKIDLALTPRPDFLISGLDDISLTGAPNLVASIGSSLSYLDVRNNAQLEEKAYTLKYVYKTSEGCTDSATKVVRIQFPPEVELSKNGAACQDSADFTINVLKSPSSKHPYGLTWSIVGGTGTIIDTTKTFIRYQPSAAEKAAGSVQVAIVTNNNGLCAAASDLSTYTIHPKPVASFSGADSGCVKLGYPFNVKLVANANPVPGCNYVWIIDDVSEKDGPDTTHDKALEIARPYKMQLYVYNPVTGCKDSSLIQYSEGWLTPKADFITDPTKTTIAKPYFNFINKTDPLANNTYIWRFDSIGRDTSVLVNISNRQFEPSIGSIPITLIATSENGCIDSTIKRITIDPDISVFVPNVFYPQTGGVGGSDLVTSKYENDCRIGEPPVPCNRHFFVQANGFETIEIYVYNRWGKLVFETKDKLKGWDGTDQKLGGECPQDAYVYQIFATSFGGKKYQYSGSVTLLR